MIEALLAAVSSTASETKELVKVQNGKVAAHMEADAKWMGEHSENHATEAGYRKGLIAVVGVLFIAANLGITAGLQLVLR